LEYAILVRNINVRVTTFLMLETTKAQKDLQTPSCSCLRCLREAIPRIVCQVRASVVVVL